MLQYIGISYDQVVWYRLGFQLNQDGTSRGLGVLKEAHVPTFQMLLLNAVGSGTE